MGIETGAIPDAKVGVGGQGEGSTAGGALLDLLQTAVRDHAAGLGAGSEHPRGVLGSSAVELAVGQRASVWDAPQDGGGWRAVAAAGTAPEAGAL